MSTATERSANLRAAIDQRFRYNTVSWEQANILRRAQITLHRWAEEMCNGTIQRRDKDGKPFRIHERGPLEGQFRGPAIPDRETGALRRVEQVCKEAGLYWYYQRDPRGCALYVAAHELNASNYTTGIACI